MTTEIANLGIPMAGVPDVASMRSTKKSDLNVLSESGGQKQTESFKDTLEKKVNEQTPNADSKPGEPDSQNKPVRLARSVTNSVAKKETNGGISERQRVMQEFMASMESELGVPPEQIVVALSQLSPRDMLRAPEDTVTEVLSGLDLNSEEAERAAELYIGMLEQLKMLPKDTIASPIFEQKQAFMGTGAFISGKERREALNKSLDNLNDRFFMQDLAFRPLPTERFAESNIAEQLPGEELMDANQQPTESSVQEDVLKDMKPVSKGDLTGADQELIRRMAMSSAAAAGTLKALKDSPEIAKTLQMEQQLAAIVDESSQSASPFGINNGEESNFDESTDFSGSNTEAFTQELEGRSQDIKLTGDTKSSDMFSLPTAEPVKSMSSETAAVRGESVPAMNVLGGRVEETGDQQANIAHIMNQAKYMIKKGGGEAKVTMSPEGMGQLHLKVLVNEGKVNIEMKAETQEAKKLLESSISDLKANLGAHRLAVDSIKVDVGNRTGNESGFGEQQPQQQKQSDMSDSQKENARQMFSMMRDDGASGRRGAFFETPGYKAYKGKSQTIDPLEPADSSKVQARRWQGAGRGSSVDLVA